MRTVELRQLDDSLWEKRLRDGLPLCPVVPLVVYHGERSWTGARSLAELVGAPSGLDEYQVDFRIRLLDLSQLTDEAIAGEPILRSTLRLLKYSRSDRLPRMLGEILQLIAQSVPEGRLPQWLQAVSGTSPQPRCLTATQSGTPILPAYRGKSGSTGPWVNLRALPPHP
jgi:hypothetical protein